MAFILLNIGGGKGKIFMDLDHEIESLDERKN